MHASKKFSSATLLVVALVSLMISITPSSAELASNLIRNEASTAMPIYREEHTEEIIDEDDEIVPGRQALLNVDSRSSHAGTSGVEHGLRAVKRHSKGKKAHVVHHHHHHHYYHKGNSTKSSDSCSTKHGHKKDKSSSTKDDTSSTKKDSSSSKKDSSSSKSDSTSTDATTKKSDSKVSTKQRTGGDSSSSSSSSSSSDGSSDTATGSQTAKSSFSSKNSTVSSSGGSGPYTRVQQNRGSGFWSGNWDWWTYDDPTHGMVQFQGEGAAKSQGLIGMKNGAAYMRTSNKDTNGNRPSVRFQTKTAYDSGLVIFDVVKMPVGCATWPALWTTKGDTWPRNGEIDVIEGVGYTANGKNANQMTVHLAQDSPLQLNRRGGLEKRASFSGEVMSNGHNCNQYGSGNTGCAFFDSNKNGPSWGSDFNAAGGGVWAMQFGNNEGVKIWYWGRKSGKIPDELSQPSVSPEKLNPSSWGTPMANFQNNVINSVIKGQNIIMDITIGGDWAGNVPMDGHCAGQNMWEAVKKGSNYNDAEFIINAIDIYCKNGKC